MASLRELIEQHPDLLMGQKKETEAELRAVETALGVRLPEDVRWLLLACGYGPVLAISNIRESTTDTLRFRAAVGIDPRYVVLNDMGDAGVVLLDTSSESSPVIWADWRVAGCLQSVEARPGDAELFESFAAWVQDRVLEFLEE
ncbi:SMI1/KNR4 family protein [Cupriavidus sp. YAF13]|uniref:SMI1/KNR4 family protein n=1 Tax=Cupriavidus sp. YAF13 TaxID=3233075 RepID=UPI003F8EC4F8